MSKTVTSALSEHMALEAVTMCTCWKIIRTDGVELGFTDHVEDVVVSGLTYEAQAGYTPTNLESNSKLSVDNVDIVGGIDSDAITAADLEAKKYDYADVYLFMVNYKSPNSGHLKLARGKMGNISIHDTTYVSELRSMTQQLQATVGEAYTAHCRADLGDARCKAPITVDAWASSTQYQPGDHVAGSAVPATYIFRAAYASTYASSAYSSSGEPSWNLGIGSTTTDGTVVWETRHAFTRVVAVTSVESRSVFHSSALVSVVNALPVSSAIASGYYAGGLVTWQASATNSTYSMEVKTYASGRIELREAMPYAIMTGDVFQIYPGCLKRLSEDCADKFDNTVNFRGEPFVPGEDQVSKVGGLV